MAVERRKDEEVRVVVRNRRATHQYEILERFEAGLVLVGSEVKSVRAGKVNLSDAYAAVRDRELYLLNLHISAYDKATVDAHEPLRPRKLLLHRRQILRLIGKVSERGLTLVPLQIHFRAGIAKVELGLARGKQRFDKRAALAERDSKREMEREKARARRA
ncbi:MAG: SsrA-binding protein SmpB [Candidatus Eisenbacteria bacterium]|uniref:SsrA-binding protein n=1 Tax=Eiseniibacteriota bacterium TaxID=2212470 RepID=A0A937X7Z5_UNCEI|nr:SsrA-binding protein SmpB [Candidatus Eisenbacteria bacterium]